MSEVLDKSFGVGLDEALGAVMEGKNVFLSGPGGSGKSTFIRQIQSLYAGSVLTVAPTGVAALNIDATTAHRSFGLGMGISTPETALDLKSKVKKLLKSKGLEKIILDEISMHRADKLWEMDQKCRIARQKNEPFGGLQVIMVGDFFQNLPILREDERELYYRFHNSELAFQHKVWEELNPYPVLLEKIFRQKSVFFSSLLNCMKAGERKKEIVETMNDQCYHFGEPIDAVTLTATNNQADVINQKFFNELKTPLKTFKARKKGTFTSDPVPEILHLKEGARVMITANSSEGDESKGFAYVNGSRGVITGLSYDGITVKLDDSGKEVLVEKHTWENIEQSPIKVKNPDGSVTEEIERKVIGSYSQYPIRLGYAVTVHRVQGLTLDKYNLDLGRGAFAPGMTYVACSRATDIRGLRLLTPLKERDIITDKRVINFYKQTFEGKF